MITDPDLEAKIVMALEEIESLRAENRRLTEVNRIASEGSYCAAQTLTEKIVELTKLRKENEKLKIENPRTRIECIELRDRLEGSCEYMKIPIKGMRVDRKTMSEPMQADEISLDELRKENEELKEVVKLAIGDTCALINLLIDGKKT